MARMNSLLMQFPIQPEMVSHDDQRWHVHLAAHGSVADRFAAGAIIGVALTVSLYGVNRLGVCAIASCHRVFIDSSPGRSRRYCTEHVTVKGNVSTLRRAAARRARRVPRTCRELGLRPLLFLYNRATAVRPGRRPLCASHVCLLNCGYGLIAGSRRRANSDVLVTHVTEMTPSDFFSSPKSIITMSPTHEAYGPRMR